MLEHRQARGKRERKARCGLRSESQEPAAKFAKVSPLDDGFCVFREHVSVGARTSCDFFCSPWAHSPSPWGEGSQLSAWRLTRKPLAWMFWGLDHHHLVVLNCSSKFPGFRELFWFWTWQTKGKVERWTSLDYCVGTETSPSSARKSEALSIKIRSWCTMHNSIMGK